VPYSTPSREKKSHEQCCIDLKHGQGGLRHIAPNGSVPNVSLMSGPRQTAVLLSPMCAQQLHANPLFRYDLEKELHALQLYEEGIGFWSIGQLLGVSHVTVLIWIRYISQEVEGFVSFNCLTSTLKISRLM
jgi:hypothetical protein